MTIVFQILAIGVLCFLILLCARVVIGLITALARDWRPSGPIVVALEGVFAVTDPPVRAVRRVVPPLTLGAIRLDLAFMIVFFVTYVMFNVFSQLAA